MARRRRDQPGVPLHLAGRRARLRWIAGAYVIATDRFISTGNVFDIGDGRGPGGQGTLRCRSSTRSSRSLPTRRTTSRGRCSARLDFDLTDQLEARVALRYDRDERENTTETPQAFIPAARCDRSQSQLRVPGPGARGDLGRLAAQVHAALQAERRRHDLRRLQPRLPQRRLQPDRRRRCRHRGHQRPVRPGDRGHLRGRASRRDCCDRAAQHEPDRVSHRRRRARTSSCSTRTPARRTSATSTKSSTRASSSSCRRRSPTVSTLYARAGYTDSEIKESHRVADDVGNQAPLVSEYTVNLGAQYPAVAVRHRPDASSSAPTSRSSATPTGIRTTSRSATR